MASDPRTTQSGRLLDELVEEAVVPPGRPAPEKPARVGVTNSAPMGDEFVVSAIPGPPTDGAAGADTPSPPPGSEGKSSS